MKTKKEIILTINLILYIMLSLPGAYGQEVLPYSRHYTLEKLADGVFVAIHNNEGGYAICNAGIIDLGDKTIILDPFKSPEAARDLKQHAEYLTGKHVSVVLNLDPHSDHTSGNQVFVPEASIIGTSNARNYMQTHFVEEYEYNRKNAPGELLRIQMELRDAGGKDKTELILQESETRAIIASLPELKLILPDITIDDTTVIYGSKRRIILMPAGTGHTNGDMLVFLPEDKIIFMSDELFVKCHPYLGDGDPESLKKNLEKVTELNPEIAVPGHGPVGDINSLYAMIGYIETLTGIVQNEIRKGTDEKAIMELPVPGKYEDYLIRSLFKLNLRFMYNKLK